MSLCWLRKRKLPAPNQPRNALFPPPWSVEELDACFFVRDHNGQQLAYVYFEDARKLLEYNPRECL
jgi:hypothetical protein